MKRNKILSIIAVLMLPLVVISFVFKEDKTNFNFKKNDEKSDILVDENEKREEISVRILIDGTVEVLPFDDYIIGVVAGEMPASFDIEALKAQAVASRTYALYKKNLNERSEYDLTSSINDQVYLTIEQMHTKWGDDYQKYYDKIKSAVLETTSQVITYDGKPIEAFYFSMSAGVTEESASVFRETRDYLKSVESLYDNNNLNNYEVTIDLKVSEFKDKLGLSCDNLNVDYIKKNDTGYVDEISVCATPFSGTKFRTLLNLRSTNFDILLSDRVSITTRGYGHGVGMSQYGANGYANHGYNYRDIIKHYYTGVEITNLSDLIYE